MNRLLWLSGASLLLLVLWFGPSLQAPPLRPAALECRCPAENDTCTCVLKGITTIPKETLKNCSRWTKINFSLNRISSLPPNSFSGFKCDRVESLQIFHNNFSGALQNNSFNGLPNLRYLNLSRNSIGTLKGRPFASCPKLRTIDLSSNRIRVISKTTFDGVSDVEYINLFGNFVGYIEEGAFSLKNLARLILAENNITHLQEKSFHGLQRLRELNLLRNPLKDIEPGFFKQMTNLYRLTVGLCGKLGGLTKVKSGLFMQSSRLTELNLTSCAVRQLDVDVFSGLVSLEQLSLRQNDLVVVDRKMWRHVKTLRTLDLSDNKIACMNDYNFYSLTSLEVLNLADNRITYVSDDAFGGLVKLKSLNLGGNPLRFVQLDAFCSMSVLSVLSLRNVAINRVITTDDKNSSLMGAISALPASVKVYLTYDDSSFQGLGTGCRTEKTAGPPKGNASCPVYLGYNTFTGKPNSRQYLLIIIGVCVSFLLMAMAVILCYRAWSKRKRTECEKAEQAAMEEEKQEMMEKPSGTNAQANGGSATTELLAAGQSAENGVVLHHQGATKPGQPEAGTKEEESTMTHLAVV